MKIIKNNCFGGFSFSKEVADWLEAHKGWVVNRLSGIEHDLSVSECDAYQYMSSAVGFSLISNTSYISRRRDRRCDPDLIECVEALGKKANGSAAELVVVEIPDDVEWEVQEYDGYETIVEQHRSW